MKPDKLQLAMAEIDAVLKRYDIAAYVLLYAEHKSEYLKRIDPTWSLARWEEDGAGLRFRGKLADFGGDRAALDRAAALTVGMLKQFSELMLTDLFLFDKVLDQLAQHVEITHTNAVHTPHRRKP